MKTYRGVVTEGAHRASALGFPTVNIPFEDSAVSGIYAARVTLEDETFEAVAFADPARKLLEAHLIGRTEDAYGKEILIELLEKIRESMPFTNDEELKAMITSDVEATRKFFTS